MVTDKKLWEAELTRLMEEKKIAGMSLALTDREHLLWSLGVGVTSVEKPWDRMSGKTLSRIASNTKITVGLCAMQLYEQGKLDPDVPLDTYIPWFVLRDRAASKRITVRKLLSHTAGLPKEYTPDGFRDEDRFEGVLQKEMSQIELTVDPDEKHYLYSNYGVRLTALAMQYITGRSYSQLCEEMVLKPLGMEASTFDLCKAATCEMALPHVRNEAGDPVVEHLIHINAVRYAAGGLYSNAEEMTALARIKLNEGSPLISKESWCMMSTPYVRMDTEQEGYYGLTLMKRRFGDRFLYGHTGSNPPYYSCIWSDPASGFGIAFTINTEGGPEFTNHLVPEFFVREF